MKNKTDVINGVIERPERLSLRASRDMMYEKFRTNLRVLSQSTNLSGVECARNIGLKSGHRLSELEYGRGNPQMEEIMAISKYFNVTIDDLLHKEAVITFK